MSIILTCYLWLWQDLIYENMSLKMISPNQSACVYIRRFFVFSTNPITHIACVYMPILNALKLRLCRQTWLCNSEIKCTFNWCNNLKVINIWISLKIFTIEMYLVHFFFLWYINLFKNQTTYLSAWTFEYG